MMKISRVGWWIVGFCLVFLLGWGRGAWGQWGGDMSANADRCSTVLADCVTLSNQAHQSQSLGDLPQARALINRSLAGLNQHPTTEHQQQILAQSLDIFGAIALHQGEFQIALEAWQQAAAIYDQFPPLADRLQQNRIHQSLAQQKLGLSLQSCATLLEGLGLNVGCEPEQWKEQDWRGMGEAGNFAVAIALGDLWRQGGYFAAARQLLEGLGIQQDRQREGLRLLTLGDVARSQGDQERAEAQAEIQFHYQACPGKASGLAVSSYDQALVYYQEVMALKLEDLGLTLPALIQQISLHQRLGQREAATALLGQIPPPTLADSRLIQPHLQSSLLQYAQMLHCLGEEAMARAWGEAIATTAEAQGNSEIAAYGYGYQGEWYEAAGQLTEAEATTAKAIAFSSGQAHLAYPWRWQMGRILAKGGDRPQSLREYQQAYQLLQSLRNNLVAFNTTMQYDFRDRVEPFYREYADLLLQPDSPTGEISQSHLRTARDVIESLQLAELDNFFQDDCTQFADTSVEIADPYASFLFTILLENRLEVIAAFPNADLQEHRVLEDVVGTVVNLMTNLRTKGGISGDRILSNGSQLYHWLIAPFEASFKVYQIKTLVFAFDTMLQGMPVAVLYDQEHQEYMIEKGFGLVTVPSSKLFSPRKIEQVRLRVLGGARDNFEEFKGTEQFSNLPYTISELERIEKIVPTALLLNEEFTREQLRVQVRSGQFPIVHIATHGKFSSQQENTFLVIGDGKLNVVDFAAGLDLRDLPKSQALELLVLSACETAEGDKRAALGMAGVALRSGARSTIATLWRVGDGSTAELMVKFYEILRATPEVGKAEALRQAQVMLLKDEQFKDPKVWAPFVLIGNWL
ncbi:CHAT domain-containing protein [Spirulina sp. CCNP1310]|uniref:CHAT domain-containing protein n=1 Tax=Spirulina sp. CCNP1310 TaxID=3110249 RepID=UPI002B213D94|nr:CHAT domain-containing protein [Spirulina sp. CCNP1310]MEA5420473.1 CHAT domain-containing protein [Spirulina sp. CCNP1310]